MGWTDAPRPPLQNAFGGAAEPLLGWSVVGGGSRKKDGGGGAVGLGVQANGRAAGERGTSYNGVVSARARCADAALRDIRTAVTPLACASVAPSGGRQKLSTLYEIPLEVVVVDFIDGDP